jgi:hypothetical protein
MDKAIKPFRVINPGRYPIWSAHGDIFDAHCVDWECHINREAIAAMRKISKEKLEAAIAAIYTSEDP